MAEPTMKVNLRLPPDLHAQLKALAEREHHSINSLLLVLIEKATKEPKKKSA